jgi:hypothetical protein
MELPVVLVETRYDHEYFLWFIYPVPPETFLVEESFPEFLAGVPGSGAVEKYVNSIIRFFAMTGKDMKHVWRGDFIFENEGYTS